MIELRNVIKEYQLGKTTVRALNGLSFTLEKGDFTCVAGPSGSGKTTLLNILGLLDRPSSGLVYIDGIDVSNFSPKKAARVRGQQIGFIFQSFNLIPVFNIYQNVELSLILAKDKDRRSWKRRILRSIEEVGLQEFIQHKPAELSGGQRQRVAIARALVKMPELVIADEPTANLDSKTALSIIELMRTLNEREGTTFVFSTHDARILAYAKRKVIIQDGRIRT